jgi:integrase
MRFPTYLLRRGGVFYYRAKVPVDLIEQVKRHEIWVSLRTSDRKTAEMRLAETHVQQLRIHDCLRQGLPAPVQESLPHHKAFKQASKVKEITADYLLEYWVGQTEKRPRTLLDAKTALRRLKEVVGEVSASQIQKSQAVALKDALIAEGLAHATVVKNIGLIKSMFELGYRNDLISTNPFRDIKLVKPARRDKPRLSFTPEDLKLIFESPVFMKGHRPIGGAGNAAVWIPLIGLMTGMRLEEIGQLRSVDIKSQEGIWYFDLDHVPQEGRWLKNDSSRRQIPIHSRLIELGFMYLVQESKARLFPYLSSAGARQLTASWSQWFGRYLRQVVGITDTRKTFHSLRHTFKDLCRDAGIPKEIHDRLTGHASSDVGDGYGSGTYPIRPLAAAISQIHLPIELSNFTLRNSVTL